MNSESFDLVVIGGGPGGYVSAIRATQCGLRVAVVEADQMGGVCLNWGCIPTKALLRSAEVYSLAKKSSEFGVNISSVEPDIEKMVARSRSVSGQLSSGVSKLMKKNNITVFKGVASFVNQNTIRVYAEKIFEISCKYCIIATGARARVLKDFESDGNLVWTYKEAMMQKNIPDSLIIVGSGAIGMEFACFYNEIGTKVTVIESRDRILPNEDEEISAIAMKVFQKSGIEFYLGVKLNEFQKNKNSVAVNFNHGEHTKTITVDRVLMATGVVANTESLDLQNVSVNLENGRVKVDKNCQTNIQNIFAIGDVASSNPMLAHKASHEGIYVAEFIASKIHENNNTPNTFHGINYNRVPSCTYTHPQIASVGLTESAAINSGKEIRVGRFKPIGNGKAIAMSETEGMIKVIFDKRTGELLGAHLCGAETTEMIHSFVVAMNCETTEKELMHSIFPHPTMSEMIHEAILDSYGRVIHF